ncbi:GNAT family N-acetyltransferase [Lysinibacillus xylanilyticus]|uniref:GNAT family N-acetyltransferase n=1 Tax=Lysinibacillus xylanilyticus TaxID=582475 RepID=UPI0038267C3E
MDVTIICLYDNVKGLSLHSMGHCIDIETLEDHRGNKLAQKSAHYFVKDCLAQDSTPYWDCMDSNKPSIAVAENAGFNNVFNYVGYEFSFN